MPPAVAITGGFGLVGSHVASQARQRGAEVTTLSRRSRTRFDLIEPHMESLRSALDGHGLLVHAAYAFTTHDPALERKANLAGTEALLTAARDAGVERTVVISSLSADPSVRSVYADTKRDIEELAVAMGASVIRPGLVWDDHATTGLVAGMRSVTRKLRVVPLPRLPVRNQSLVQADDLADVILTAGSPHPEILSVGHPDLLDLRDIVHCIAERLRVRRSVVQIPGTVASLGLALAELAHLPLPFRRDNLRGALTAAPPEGLDPEPLGVHLRPFRG